MSPNDFRLRCHYPDILTLGLFGFSLKGTSDPFPLLSPRIVVHSGTRGDWVRGHGPSVLQTGPAVRGSSDE